jgi:TolB protein
MPTWSPDGKYIAFVSKRDGNYEVYAMGVGGSNPVNLIKPHQEPGG